MLACCARNLEDLLPLVWLSAAAVLLAAYRTPVLLLGIGLDVPGIAAIGRQLVQAARACTLGGPSGV